MSEDRPRPKKKKKSARQKQGSRVWIWLTVAGVGGLVLFLVCLLVFLRFTGSFGSVTEANFAQLKEKSTSEMEVRALLGAPTFVLERPVMTMGGQLVENEPPMRDYTWLGKNYKIEAAFHQGVLVRADGTIGSTRVTTQEIQKPVSNRPPQVSPDRRVRLGMTEAELIVAMGEPRQKVTKADHSILTWIWQGREINVAIVDGKVWGGTSGRPTLPPR